MEAPVLLLIDVQREYFDEGSSLRIPDGPTVLDQLGVLLDAARASGVPVVHVRHEEAPGNGVFEPGSENIAIMDRVAPAGDEPVVLKHLPGAFDETELAGILANLGARTVVIGGFMTHMCCDTTAREAAARGYAVAFLADGTATRDLEAPGGRIISHRDVHETTLAAQADGFSAVQSIQDVVRSFGHSASR
jgi:nicotinamidase-related amidase